MTLETCTEALREHDPDRFGAALVARPEDRPRLVTLYALNLELARAPFQSQEPMLAEMRLQWWVDRLTEMGQGEAPPLHDVLSPLWYAWGAAARDLVTLADARRRDCAGEPFADVDAALAYIDATAGGLMWAAAQGLGAPSAAKSTVLAQGRGAGVAAWLRALPQLRQLGRGFALKTPEHISRLAAAGHEALAQARASRKDLPRQSAPALFAGPAAVGFLREVIGRRGEVTADIAAISPFRRRAALAQLALTGRWWA